MARGKQEQTLGLRIRNLISRLAKDVRQNFPPDLTSSVRLESLTYATRPKCCELRSWNLFWIWPLVVVLTLAVLPPAFAAQLDQLSLDRWAKLREVERYQMQIAERYYKQQNWKIALAEYEKYVTLYEQGEGASHAQLKWSLCQVQLRQSNTAIRDGFQSVIDYWPDSPDAPVAAYYIGHTYKGMGQLDKAKKAYEGLSEDHAEHAVAVYALVDLVDIAEVEKDLDARAGHWKQLTFDVKRDAQTSRLCQNAARQYAGWSFSQGTFESGAKALATTYADADLLIQVAAYACPALSRLVADAETRSKAERMASEGTGWLRQQLPQEDSTPEQKAALRKGLFAVADVHAAALQDDKVVKVYDEIVRRCGASDEILGRMASWHERRERFDEAYRVYRRYEKKPDGLSRIASSYRRRNLRPAAIDIYRELTGLDADNQIRWTAEIAATHREARQWKESIAVYRQLIQNDPTNTPNWLWQIGTTHRYAGQWKEAIGVLRQCTNFPHNLMMMAECHRRLKEYREALVLYNQIGSDPSHAPWSAYQIAATWEESGEKEKAIKAFQRVCKRFPKSSHASTAHARLQTVYKISVTLGGAMDE